MDSKETIALEHMSVGKLRKSVSALRKKACPPVSRMKKEGLIGELKAYGAEVKARDMVAAGKQFKMKDKPAKAAVAEAKGMMKMEEVKTETKEKKGASAYNKFVGEKMKAGMTMKEAAAAWKAR